MTTSRPGASAGSRPSLTGTTATTPATTPVTTPATSRTRPTPATTPGTTPATTPSVRAGALELTLAPVGADVFFAERWERRPLVVERGEAGRFDAVLSAADVERLVCETGIRMPAFRLVRDGKP